MRMNDSFSDIPLEAILSDINLAIELANSQDFVFSEVGVSNAFLDSHDGNIAWRVVARLAQSTDKLNEWLSIPGTVTKERLLALNSCMCSWIVGSCAEQPQIVELFTQDVLLGENGYTLSSMVDKYGLTPELKDAIGRFNLDSPASVPALFNAAFKNSLILDEWITQSSLDSLFPANVLTKDISGWFKQKLPTSDTVKTQHHNFAQRVLNKLLAKASDCLMPVDLTFDGSVKLSRDIVDDAFMVYEAGFFHDEIADQIRGHACVVETILAVSQSAKLSQFMSQMLKYHADALICKIETNSECLDQLISDSVFRRLSGHEIVEKIQAKILLEKLDGVQMEAPAPFKPY